MRRGQGEGSIHRRPDGLWEAQISLGFVGGKRKRRSFYGRTRAEVRERMEAALRDLRRGVPVSTGRLTIEEYLLGWLEDVERTVRPKTYAAYRLWITHHVIPELGGVRLDKLGPQEVQRFLTRKLGTGLSPRSVHHIRAVLRQALQRAVKWGLISRNAAALADPPHVPQRPLVQISADDARRILEVAYGTRLEALVAVTLFTGLRQGEVLGLRWSDIDLDARTLTVALALQRLPATETEPSRLALVQAKTSRSRRSVSFPAVLADTLRSHRARQAEDKLRAGQLWQERIRGLVFTTVTGGPLSGVEVTKAYQRQLARAGLPRWRYHDLRHACATLLLASGVDIAVVRDILGHSTIALTANTYAAVLPSLQREAAERLADFIGFAGPLA
jgi:integrase